MALTLSVFLSLILTFSAYGQEGPDYAPDAPPCGEIAGLDFESSVNEFIAGWKGEPEFCGFKRFTVLNEMIAEDMTQRPSRYSERMNFLLAQKDKNPEAVNYLLISFQETWFNTYIDSILLREDGRSGTWSRWLTIGAAGSAAALLALPFTKKYSSKPLRLFKTGLKHFLQKRAITFGSTSISSQLDRFTPERKKKTPEVFVAPPLYFGSNEDILDERTYKIFLNEVQDDVISASAGVLGGWFLGHGASVVIRDHTAKSWAESALGRFAWTRTKPAVFASPGMITGFAVTIVATNAISDFTSDMIFQKRFGEIRGKLSGDLRQLKAAVSARREFVVYSQAEKLKNDLALQNFILTRQLTEDLGAQTEKASEILLNQFQYCFEPRERQIARAKLRFFKDVEKLVALQARQVRAALKLAQDAQSVFLAHPHALTKTLASTNDKLMMRTTWLLDPVLTASDLWEDLIVSIKDQPVECANMTHGMPL